MSVVAEICDSCNLKCALCWNRNRIPSKKQMELKTVQKILDKFGRTRIGWYNWGEPLLHTEFPKIAEMVKKSYSCISSSLSLDLEDSYFDALRNFRTVYVSISGMTEEVYKIYNRGGNFELVMSNLRKLVARNKNRIVLVWQGHPFNVHQKEECKKLCMDLGIEFSPTTLNCEVEDLVMGFNHALLKNPKFKESPYFNCKLLFNTLPIDVDGNYLLCCASHNVKTGYSIWDDVTQGEVFRSRADLDLCVHAKTRDFGECFRKCYLIFK